ncbi:MAG: malate dehydrogenase [Candidatus Omnitrophota bacterium]
MKISIIGAGNVGATCAMRLLEADFADIVLLDIEGSLAKGKAEDLMDAASLIGHNRIITGTSDYKETQNSNIVVITAGFPRKPGMSREELLSKNASIVKEVAGKVAENSKDSIIIVVTNPLDVMSYLVYKESGFDSRRVMGMAGVLDASRMDLMLSRYLNEPLRKIESLVLGTHGETMVPIVSHSKVDGKTLSGMLEDEALSEVIKRTKSRGAEIVSYLGKGSAYYAPSAGVYRMVKAIIKDTNEVLPCSCLLQGEYGIKQGVYLGVPAEIGKSGARKIVELPLSADESSLLQTASDSVRKQIRSLGL